MEDMKKFVLHWNNRNPLDRWWRQKHGVAFNSEVHRVSSFIDQLYEFIEDKMAEESDEIHSKPISQDEWLKKVEPKREEIDLSSIDLDIFK